MRYQYGKTFMPDQEIWPSSHSFLVSGSYEPILIYVMETKIETEKNNKNTMVLTIKQNV